MRALLMVQGGEGHNVYEGRRVDHHHMMLAGERDHRMANPQIVAVRQPNPKAVKRVVIGGGKAHV